MLQDCSLSNVCFNINSSYTGENCIFCTFRRRTLSNFFAFEIQFQNSLLNLTSVDLKLYSEENQNSGQSDERRDASEYGQWEYMENDVSSY